MNASLDAVFAPRSIAIIGASDDPTRIGGRPLRYILDAGFKGGVYPVNPKRETVQGLKAFADIGSVPHEVDAAILAVPAAATVAAAKACAAKGVKAITVFSAGYAETGDSGAGLQEELLAVTRPAGMRVVGPNCLGLFNVRLGYYPIFSTTLDRGLPTAGGVAIASQSGAYGTHIYMLAKQRGADVGYCITTGNEADVTVAESIEWLAGREDVDVIAAYIEGVRDGGKLLRAFAAARAAKKPVVVMKVGRSEIGAEAARSHTASLAGSDAVFDAACAAYGIHRARTTAGMIDAVYLCARLKTAGARLPTGNRFGIVSISGGGGVLMADDAADYGLDVAPMPADAQAELKAALPFASPRNPVDTTAHALNEPNLIRANMEIMLRRGGYDSIVAFFTTIAGSKALIEPLIDNLVAARKVDRETPIALSLVAPPDMVKRYEDAGFPVFEDPTAAVAALAAATQIGVGAPERVAVNGPDLDLAPGARLSEHDAKTLLRAAGLPFPDERLCATPDAARAAAAEIGGRFVVKIASPDILHKTEIGGVKLGLDTPDAVAAAAAEVLAAAASKAPDARVDGVIVAPMISGGVETIMGVSNDPVFGPVLMFGLGGVFVEVMKDVAFRLCPIDAPEARVMIDELKGAALLKGARGAAPADLDALAQTLALLSQIAAANANLVETIDLNPVLARPDGCVALDALVVVRDRTVD